MLSGPNYIYRFSHLPAHKTFLAAFPQKHITTQTNHCNKIMKEGKICVPEMVKNTKAEFAPKVLHIIGISLLGPKY